MIIKIRVADRGGVDQDPGRERTVRVRKRLVRTRPGSGSYRVLTLKNHNLRLFFDTKVKIIYKFMLCYIFGKLIFEEKVWFQKEFKLIQTKSGSDLIQKTGFDLDLNIGSGSKTLGSATMTKNKRKYCCTLQFDKRCSIIKCC